MTKPNNLVLISYEDAKWVKFLQQAKLEVKVDHTSGLRDLEAFEKFCDEEFAPDLLDRIRLAFLVRLEQNLREDGLDPRAGTRPISKESEVVSEAYQEVEG